MQRTRLRIVIPTLHYFPDFPSGSARLAFDEALLLANLGHEVYVLTQDIRGVMPEYCLQDGLHVLRYPSPRAGVFDPRRITMHQERAKDLLSRYVGNQVDLVHGHSLLQFDGTLSLYYGKCRQGYSVHSPVLLEMRAASRGVPVLKRWWLRMVGRLAHRIERRCLASSDFITVESNYTSSLLGELHGDRILKKTRVIPGWVDVERFRIIPDREEVKSALGWPTDVPVFFTLRRLEPRMGLDRLLKALHQVKLAGWRFHMMIGGDGSLRTRLERLTFELQLDKQVCFAGFVPEEKLPLMYGAADAFILPTAELECFGLIALESLACGRPVLATPVAVIPELLGHFEPRWMAQNASEDGIAQLLIEFLSGKLPSYEPESLRRTVVKHYSKERVLEELVAVALSAGRL